MTEPILDGDLIRQARLQAGLSRRRLARLTGLTAGVIERLEHGRSHRELTLGKLELLADALATSPASLYHRPAVPPAPDDITVEAALATSSTRLRADELARGLGWSLGRTHAALRALRRRLQATGQDLRRTSNGYALIARGDALTRDQRQRLERARLARRGLNITAARLLYRIYAGLVDVHLEQRLRNPERVALGVLLKVGLVECREGRYVLPASVRTSLAAPPKPAARHRSPRSKRKAAATRASGRSRRAGERSRATSHGDRPTPRG